MTEPDVSGLLTVAQAIGIIDATQVWPRVVELPLGEARQLVLAEAIVADRDYPPFDKSLMDGFAVRCADVMSAPVDLRVLGEVSAGKQSARGVGEGETIAIMTGAPMPDGADGVVPVEDVEKSGTSVRILRATTPGRFIAKRGSDILRASAVLCKGMSLNPAALAVAASVGAGRVRVFDRPKVAVLSTGDELVPVEQTPGTAQIRNSNALMLVALLERLGCAATDLGIVRDDPRATRDALARAMEYDVLLVTGGMSMGEYDYVPRTLRDLGAELKITKLRIKPGKPFVFGVKDGRFIFGLPGNPLAGFVCTIRLAARLIARLRGGEVRERWVEGVLAEPLLANGPREFYQPAKVQEGRVTPLPWKSSADLFTLARADGLLVRAENEPARRVGELVRVLEV